MAPCPGGRNEEFTLLGGELCATTLHGVGKCVCLKAEPRTPPGAPVVVIDGHAMGPTTWRVRDLWRHKDLSGVYNASAVLRFPAVPPHNCVMLTLTPITHSPELSVRGVNNNNGSTTRTIKGAFASLEVASMGNPRIKADDDDVIECDVVIAGGSVAGFAAALAAAAENSSVCLLPTPK